MMPDRRSSWLHVIPLASAQEKPHPGELSTAQAKALLDQVAGFPRRPMLVMTGGDPLKRADLFELIAAGRELGRDDLRGAR